MFGHFTTLCMKGSHERFKMKNFKKIKKVNSTSTTPFSGIFNVGKFRNQETHKTTGGSPTIIYKLKDA